MWMLRFPVPAGAPADAEAVQLQHRTRALELTTERDPRLMRGVGMVITVFGTTALMLAFLLFRTNLRAALLITLLIGGIMFTPAGLLIAIVRHRRMPRRSKNIRLETQSAMVHLQLPLPLAQAYGS